MKRKNEMLQPSVKVKYGIALLTIGVFLYVVVGLLIIPYWFQEKAAEKIRQMGGIITKNYGAVGFNCSTFGDKELSEIAPCLQDMHNLKVLAIQGKKITDASVPVLKNLHDSHGVIIAIDKTSITEAGHIALLGQPISQEDAMRLLNGKKK